jgi:hypothetical protein
VELNSQFEEACMKIGMNVYFADKSVLDLLQQILNFILPRNSLVVKLMPTL